VTRRETHLPSRRETAWWFLVRVCVVEVLLIAALALDISMHVNGIR